MSVFCTKCRIEFGPREGALWCPMAGCPITEQRGPTEAQEIRFQMENNARIAVRIERHGERTTAREEPARFGFLRMKARAA